MQTATTPLAHAHDAATRRRWVEGLATLIGFPTVSAQRSARPHLERCAAWLADYLQALGMHRARVLPGINGSPPSVYADWLGAPGQPTVLLYAHYDVQPAEPLHEWRRPPFRATIEGTKIYGRGASDDKGQLFIQLCALESYLRSRRRLPVNVKVWIEGEEELMSPTIEPFFDRFGDLIRAGVAVVSDTELARSGPAIVYGLRGALAFELEVQGARHELHSGRFGGAVRDPIAQLAAVIARMHDRYGRITIPGFLDGVRQIPWAERTALRRGHRDIALLRELGAAPGPVYDGFSVAELATIRPAITFHGIRGGYAGPGWKAVVPERASVRGSARLVPDQDPRRVAAAIAAFARGSLAGPLRWRLRFGRGARGIRMSTTAPAFAAAAQAVRDVWGAPPPFVVTGGTIPAVEALHRRLRIPVVVLGFGNADDRIHAADERFDLPTFFAGVDTVIRLLAELAR